MYHILRSKFLKLTQLLTHSCFLPLIFHLNFSEEESYTHSFHFLNLLLSGFTNHPSKIALTEATNYFLMSFPQEYVGGLGRVGNLK